jgi:hypothetical protein
MQGRLVRIEAGLEQLLKRIDAMAAVQGDIAEGTRMIGVTQTAIAATLKDVDEGTLGISLQLGEWAEAGKITSPPPADEEAKTSDPGDPEPSESHDAPQEEPDDVDPLA